LDHHAGLKNLIESQTTQNKMIAAICAAPSILGKMKLLKGKEAICYPGFEGLLIDAKISDEKIVKSGNIHTAKAAGVAIQFALHLVQEMKGKEVADSISKAIFL
ncbi:MAG: DJ-1/PfpI family protein, partial [Paludibacter sp.]|nr:DJ-1/PfpI family protein [Paludibacter sp.]